MTLHFSTRSRALASLVTALAQIFATGIMGTFLDWKRLTLNQRARFGFLGMMTLSGGIWAWAIVIQHKCQRSIGLTAPSERAGACMFFSRSSLP